MNLDIFKVEQWMTIHEGNAKYKLTDTCMKPLTWQELQAYDTNHLLDTITLDYGDITGSKAVKEEILSLYNTGDIDNITCIPGCLLANQTVMDTLLEKGDTVICYTPGYQQFYDYPKSLSCNVIKLPLYEENDWQPSIDDLEDAMQNDVKLIIMNNPSNPTGVIFEETYINKMIELATKQNTWILADEVYRGLNNQPSMSDLYDKAISTSSLSKIYSVAGIRFGWIKGSKEIIEKINYRRDYTFISCGPLSDMCAQIVLLHKEEILKKNLEIIEKNKEVVRKWLEENPSFSLVMPKSGTVGFLKYDGDISSEELATTLQEKYGVMFVPGCCFDDENHLRLTFTCENEVMSEGLELFKNF